MNTQTIFISDLHLSADVPQLNALFFQSLQDWRGKIDALYILGDFFDVSEVSGERPEGVKQIGGGVEQFLDFLRKQADE